MSDETSSLLTYQSDADDRIFFRLLERAGISGRYQFFTVVIMCIIGYLCGGLMLTTPFLFYQDPYQCTGSIPYDQTCSDYVCTLPPEQRTPFIPRQQRMSTLSTKFGDYRCDQQRYTIALITTIMYSGYALGFLGLTLVGDLMGRKMLLIVNLFLVILGLLMVIFCWSLMMAGVGLLIITSGIQNSFNDCFYFISETMLEEDREKVSVLIQMVYGFGVLLNVIWYWWFADWQVVLILFYLIPLLVVTGGSIFYLRDTPICLVTRQPEDEALKDFKFIAKSNAKKDFNLTQYQIKAIRKSYESKLSGSSHEKKHTFSALDLFRQNSLRMMTIILIFLHCTIIFEFYAPSLLLDQFKLDIFINGLVVGVSEIISYPICYYMITFIKRRQVAYVCFFITLLCSIVLIFVWKQGDTQNQDLTSSIFVSTLIFVFRSAISVQYTYFYVYFNELYPTQVRVIGTGLVCFMGGVMVTVAPQIIHFCISSGFPIMIIFAVLSCLSLYYSSKLPETLGVPPQDEILELREMHISPPNEQYSSEDRSIDSPLLSYNKPIPNKSQPNQ